METNPKTLVTITATVNVSAAKAWLVWNAPEHIVNWNFASDDWHCPAAKSDLREGGTLLLPWQRRTGVCRLSSVVYLTLLFRKSNSVTPWAMVVK